ncbi:ArsR family transcriptional regulator [Butyrivibrio sp. X503]|uniref:ArsR/SmtB family transcription factor n=1 Tax=Butyrivibrio sp. X503 TaxID=2364878 RepID=UPI000EA85603|nr:metalloregulator ArsR/SmtB family transcription factor [Butyrivibrio sp. X503]RKM55338.1 ArsR family transcriptional regulator [Butyrivibrio sp. X503]
MDENEVIKICKALGDRNRLKIIQILLSGEKCVCVIDEYLKITQPTLSHHMKVLGECKLVNSRRDGKWVYYSINKDTVDRFKGFFGDLVIGDEGCCCGK